MLLTVKEAKKKSCIKNATLVPVGMCIADECMTGWRWEEWSWRQREAGLPLRGFCGIGGKPHDCD